MTLAASVVICTRNRPDDLARCLGSLGGQTRPPAETVVVDASDEDASRRVVEVWAAGRPGARVHHLHAAPGLTHQRNVGIEAATADVVTFLDDDVILAPDYLARILDLFEANPALGGAEGAVATPRLGGRRRLANLFRRAFLMNSLGSGRGVRRSGFVVYDPWPRAVQPVTSLVGCNMSYRTEVVRRFRFDEWFDGYGLFEDQDFSWRVGRTHRLVQTPHARLEHRLSSVSRAQLPALHEMTGVNHFYFVRKNLPDTPLTWLCFLWSELGELVSVLKTGDGPAVAGKLRGYRRIQRMRRRRDARAVPVEEAST
jgi:GT2 family glycosyltransferase